MKVKIMEPDCGAQSPKQFVFEELDLTVRPNWQKLFGRNAPIELEIGIGNGEFIVGMALSHPERNFVGVELVSRYLQKAKNRVIAHGLMNVRLIHGEGGTCLSKLFSPRSVDAIYINFPDPWEKPKHSRRRLVDKAFASLAASRLQIGGTFMMVTDSHSYAMSAKEVLKGVGVLSPSAGRDGVEVGVPNGFVTKYYRKWMEQGRTIYSLRFKKVCHCDLPSWVLLHYPLADLEAPLPMPHVVIHGHVDDWQKLASEMKIGIWVQLPMLVIKCEEIFVERNGNGLLLSMLCVEGKLQQRLFVRVLSRCGETVVQLHPACRLNVTVGIQQSVGMVTQALMQATNMVQILRSNLGEMVHKWLGWEIDLAK